MAKFKRVRAKLLRALDEQRMVRLERSPKFADQLDGFVVALGAKWGLLAQIVDGGFFDGYVAFRLRDVQRIKWDRTFQTAHAKTQPEWPPHRPPEIGLDSTAELVASLGGSGALISLKKENERRATWIGILDEIQRKFVYLLEVRPDASWHSVPLGYKLRAITSVGIGTRYLTGLAAIAGAAPEPNDAVEV